MCTRLTEVIFSAAVPNPFQVDDDWHTSKAKPIIIAMRTMNNINQLTNDPYHRHFASPSSIHHYSSDPFVLGVGLRDCFVMFPMGLLQ